MLWNSKCSEWNLIVFYIPALHPFTISKLGCCFVVLNTIWSCQLIRPLVRGMTCWSLFSTCVVQFIVSSRRSWGYTFCGGSDSELWMTLQTLFLIVIAHTPSYVWFRCKKGLERWVFLTSLLAAQWMDPLTKMDVFWVVCLSVVICSIIMYTLES